MMRATWSVVLLSFLCQACVGSDSAGQADGYGADWTGNDVTLTDPWEYVDSAEEQGEGEAEDTQPQPARYWLTMTLNFDAPVHAVSFSSDSTLMAYSVGSRVEVRSTTDWSVVASLEDHEDTVYALAFDPTVELLVSGGHDEVKIWNASSDEFGYIRSITDYHARSLAFSPDGAYLAVGRMQEHPVEYGAIRIWNTHGWSVKKKLSQLNYDVRSVCFSPDGTLLAASNLAGAVGIYKHPGWHENRMLQGFVLPGAMSFCRDSSCLAVADAGGATAAKIYIFDANNWETVSVIEARPAEYAIAFSPDGSILASGGSGQSVRLWDFAHKRLLTKLTGFAGDVLAVAFSNNALFLSAGASDGILKVWRYF